MSAAIDERELERAVVARARVAVDRHRGIGDLPALLDALDELAGAIDTLDAANDTTTGGAS